VPTPRLDSFADFRFSEQSLAELLSALRARAASHPENPGLVACWPAVIEHRMARACSELIRLGYPVKRVSVAAWAAGKARDGWALGV
jgi:hypothetical protein